MPYVLSAQDCPRYENVKEIIESEWSSQESEDQSNRIPAVLPRISLSQINDRDQHKVSRSLNTKFRTWFGHQKVTDQLSPIVVPGYSDEELQGPLHMGSISRLKKALCYVKKNSFFILTGGNVSPKGTVYNEALEMKRWLVQQAKVPEYRIFVEPYANNTSENLYNIGVVLRALKLEKAWLVTDPGHNFMISHPLLTGLIIRAYFSGYSLGVETMRLDKNTSLIRVNP